MTSIKRKTRAALERQVEALLHGMREDGDKIASLTEDLEIAETRLTARQARIDAMEKNLKLHRQELAKRTRVLVDLVAATIGGVLR